MFQENSIETCVLSRVKQITGPGWMHETRAQGWCTGKTQRDGMEREAGGGSGWGTQVNPWLIHVNVWQKPIQYCKVISPQLIKINEKTNKQKESSCKCRRYRVDSQSEILHAARQLSPCFTSQAIAERPTHLPLESSPNAPTETQHSQK